MKLLDLFSGIGGFSYGLENLGFKTVDNLKKGKKVAGAIKDEMVDPIRKFIKERNIKILKDSLQKEYMKTVKDRKRRG